jgi:hypothetical protein
VKYQIARRKKFYNVGRCFAKTVCVYTTTKTSQLSSRIPPGSVHPAVAYAPAPPASSTWKITRPESCHSWPLTGATKLSRVISNPSSRSLERRRHDELCLDGATTFSITTLSIMVLYVTLSIKHRHYAECHVLFIIMLNVIRMSVMASFGLTHFAKVL